MATNPAITSPRCEFEVILDDFKAQLTVKELDEFKFASLHGLRTTIKLIQKEQEAKRRMQHMRRLEPFLRTMEQYGAVLEVFVNTSETLAFIWGPMKWLLIIASNYSAAMDGLLDAYQTIWQELPFLSNFQELCSDRPYMKTILSWIYQDILDFHREAMAYFRNKAWKQLFQAAWRGFKTKVDLIKGRMQRNANLIKTEASLAQFEDIRRIHKAATDEFTNQRQAELDRRRLYVTQWIGAPNIYAIQEEIYEARVCPNAGSWLISSSLFKKWFDPVFCDDPLLWMTGKPGAGKSVLVSRVVDEIRQLQRTSSTAIQDMSVAFFYCKHQHADYDSFLAAVKGLLSQLLAQNSHLIHHFYEEASLSGEPALRTKSLARKLLEAALKCSKRTYVILDGLDECERKERKDITSFLRQIVESLPAADMAAIRCLFVCQDDGAARKDLADIPSIKIVPSDTKDDIENFCEVRKREIEQKMGSLQKSGYDIVKIVTGKAQGMFLFAKLVMENLYEQTTRDNLLAELENFPTGLNEAYDRIMIRILDRRTAAGQADAKTLLAWLACSKRPMKWYEVQAATSIDINNYEESDAGFSRRRWCESPKDLCGSLLEYHQDQTLSFVHPTAREYLIKTQRVNPSDMHFQITCLTLGYLTLPPNDYGGDQNDLRKSIMNGFFGYLEYSVVCWVLHLQEVLLSSPESKRISELSEALDVFLEGHYQESQNAPFVPKTTSEELSIMKSFQSHDKLSQAVVWARKQLTTFGQASKDDDILDLVALVYRFRDVLEDLANAKLSDDDRSNLESLYGTRWYKCRYMGCFYFHHGFMTKNQREQHVNRHEKPFVCIVLECDFSSLGFASKSSLTDHMLEEHGIDMDENVKFPQPPRKIRRIEAGLGKHQCPKCFKTFTRGHNLRAHVRSHTDEKPYSCSVCGMKFGRQYDKQRHEGIHTGEPSFKCFGTLKSGATWGCNLAFRRQDNLAAHFKSKTGQQCLQPLLIEERQEIQAKGPHMTTDARLVSLIDLMSPQDRPLFQAEAHHSYQHQPSLPSDFFETLSQILS